ncbi:hypothetical protein NH340_JMT00022 [Sarcoptes scabiei]|nr:hypothetical protein NH340_JMT00022 [Sarcoptes scabiei]
MIFSRSSFSLTESMKRCAACKRQFTSMPILTIILLSSMHLVTIIFCDTLIDNESKSFESFGIGPTTSASIRNEPSILFKRSNELIPLREAKSELSHFNRNRQDVKNNFVSGPYEQDEADWSDSFEKRSRFNSFMPMRGRKSDPIDSIRSRQSRNFEDSSDRLNEFYGSISRRLPFFYQLFSSFTRPNIDYSDSMEQKRAKGLAFFGSRGKRSFNLN